jgi:hypothetical protein
MVLVDIYKTSQKTTKVMQNRLIEVETAITVVAVALGAALS